jgi:hypothetical protein
VTFVVQNKKFDFLAIAFVHFISFNLPSKKIPIFVYILSSKK